MFCKGQQDCNGQNRLEEEESYRGEREDPGRQIRRCVDGLCMDVVKLIGRLHAAVHLRTPREKTKHHTDVAEDSRNDGQGDAGNEQGRVRADGYTFPVDLLNLPGSDCM